MQLIQPHKKSAPITIIDTGMAGALSCFISSLAALLEEPGRPCSQLLVLCIGSDRCTGDALGPLVGSLLLDMNPPNTTVLGTLYQPVHALNLQENVQLIEKEYKHAAVLAVDACLGQKNKIGSVELGRGALKPGAAVQKKLPPVGDIFINGIVNEGGFMEYMVLQNTRLGTVLPLARFIGRGTYMAITMTGWLSGSRERVN